MLPSTLRDDCSGNWDKIDAYLEFKNGLAVYFCRDIFYMVIHALSLMLHLSYLKNMLIVVVRDCTVIQITRSVIYLLRLMTSGLIVFLLWSLLS